MSETLIYRLADSPVYHETEQCPHLNNYPGHVQHRPLSVVRLLHGDKARACKSCRGWYFSDGSRALPEGYDA